MADTIQLRRGTAAQWSSANPVLAAGEPGYATDTDTLKVGDGTTAWNALDAIEADAASTTVAGIVELATSAETITGTDTVRGVTPAGAAAAYAPKTRAVTALTPTTGSVALDLSTLHGSIRTHAITGNITYTTSNLADGREVTIIITCDATARTFTFPAGWVFVGAKPTGIAISKKAVLTLTATSTTDASVVAAYAVQT